MSERIAIPRHCLSLMKHRSTTLRPLYRFCCSSPKSIGRPGFLRRCAIWSSRNRQYVASGGRPKKTALVFFFPQRPTIEHARGQSMKGKSRVQRYLYELQPTHGVDVVYARTSAWATPADLTALVVCRQELEPLRGRRQ